MIYVIRWLIISIAWISIVVFLLLHDPKTSPNFGKQLEDQAFEFDGYDP